MTGPFIVTHQQHCACGGCDARVVCREAFATLEESACFLHRITGSQCTGSDWSYDQCLCKFPESGGAVTLPNGDVIEVEATTYPAMYCSLSSWAQDYVDGFRTHQGSEPATLRQWNAEHGIGIGIGIGDETMTGDDIRERILELADDIRDMGGRIGNVQGEPNYSAEKAFRAAKAAVQIMAIADARAGVAAGSDNGRFVALSKTYADELRDCRRFGIGERA